MPEREVRRDSRKAVPFITMQDIGDFVAYQNKVTLDKERTLLWSNAAIVNAIQFYKELAGEEVKADQIRKELREGKLRAIQALLFGALKAEQDTMNIKLFGDIYKSERLAFYVNAVLDGMIHYVPEAESKDNGENLDTEWPDTQSQVKKKKKTSHRSTGVTGTGFVKK